MQRLRSVRPIRISALEAIALVCAFLILALIGWSRCYDPLVGDQALFLIGAEKLAAGGVLYRDFWDIKQPGVFAFFLAGGRLFGFDQIGEHAADLLWQLAFAAALVAGLRGCFGRERIVLAFAPLAVIGSYYAGSSSWHLLQVEELVGLPLFGCAALLLAAIRRSSARLALASGLCAAAVLAFKLLFAIIVLALVAATLATTRASLSRRSLRQLASPWLAGILLPVAAFTAYAVAHAATGTTLQTTFVIPVEVLLTAEMHAPAARLADSAMRFLLYFRGLIFLGLIGLVTADRTSARALAWRAIAAAWILADGVVIAIQLSSWWQYHFLLLVPPVGILASFGWRFSSGWAARASRRRSPRWRSRASSRTSPCRCPRVRSARCSASRASDRSGPPRRSSAIESQRTASTPTHSPMRRRRDVSARTRRSTCSAIR